MLALEVQQITCNVYKWCQRTCKKKKEERNKKIYPLTPTPYLELIQSTKFIMDMGLTSTYNLTLLFLFHPKESRTAH